MGLESGVAEEKPAAARRIKAVLLAGAEWARSLSDRRSRALVWVGLAACLLLSVPLTSEKVPFSPEGVRLELYGRKEDIHNLYFAAASASWSDAPHWWVGSWIYPDVGYYRPLTSMLFLSEYRAFGSNFTAYNRVSQILHLANVGLLYLLAVSLFRSHRRARVLVGLAAAYFFSSTDNSMFFAVARVIEWWPAQNDILSLTFALLSLLLLDQYLHRGKARWLVGSLGALFLSIASKEMGFIAAPCALALVAQRRAQGIGPWRAPAVSISLLTGFLWVFRRLVIPHHWGPVMFRRQILERMLVTWSGPAGLMAYAQNVWPAVASVSMAIICAVGLRRRWPVAWMLGLCGIAASVSVMICDPDGTPAILLFWQDEERLASAILYLLAGILFLRYFRREPALFTGIALWLVYLPILQYGGGRHYYYWPGAFNALADAAFAVCLWRWAAELRSGANWEWRLPFWKGAIVDAERENASVS